MASSSSDDTTAAAAAAASSTTNPQAFRSFWNAPTAQINTTSADEYQGIPRARVTEATPLLPTVPDNSASKRQRYTICCLVLVLLLIMAAVWFWFHHSAAVVPGLIIHSDENDIATICNPFSYAPKPKIDLVAGHGIVATIRYLQDPNEQSLAHTTIDYQHGAILNQTFYLSSFNVPTRSFTNQFQDQQQHLLPSQFFAMTAYTKLGLTKEDQVGDYQLALLSDDGSTLTVNDHPSYTLIDNDGIHTTQLATAKRNLTFHHQEQKYDIIVNWFQGPPSHIALMLLWRPSSANLAEPNDGISGNDEWFNWRSTSTSVSTAVSTATPTSRYKELLEHGWRVIPADNFWLPEKFPQKPVLEAKLARGEDPCA